MSKNRSSTSRRLRRGSQVAIEDSLSEGGIKILNVPGKNKAAFLHKKRRRILKLGAILKGKPKKKGE